jgi:hypothetical protein
MHYATSAGPLSTRKMSQAKESFFNRGVRRGTLRTKAEKRKEEKNEGPGDLLGAVLTRRGVGKNNE